ncbi:hypothetical protein [Janthinobacterium sp. 17J80-10]|uniref:hypothetical protein n=1 Tax=Janthinobacterium sp. 17J80-10 TaxID=2497863 RepID=UPI0010055BAE|nr:hypothetical protein [Janthinobacterium sp. 17J80-10]QAU35057.1 hypothetical protein EKL02_13200 [Janthinobacterium sp. 17J80-10]
MDSDIIIVREEMHYRVLYGHLRLAGVLSTTDEVCVDVKGEGTLKIRKTRGGMSVKKKHHQLPVL